MKAKIVNKNGVDYLSFTPEGMRVQTEIPVITKGSRDEANAWTWNGSLEKPTVRPSVRTQYVNEKGEMVMIHYWLNDGVCQCLSDCTDGNAGKNLFLIDVVADTFFQTDISGSRFQSAYAQYWDKVKDIVDEEGWVYTNEAPHMLDAYFEANTGKQIEFQKSFGKSGDNPHWLTRGSRWRPIDLS